MSQTLQLAVSEETYKALASLAAGQGETPETFINNLIDALWEQECAKYDAAFHDDPDWQESARKASEAAQAGQQSEKYATTAEFFRRLGASKEQVEAQRQKDQPDGEHANP